MLIIYHSRDPFPARLAAALQEGGVPEGPPSDLEPVRQGLGGDEATKAKGLWQAGQTADGLRICALGRASRPDVIHRAFHSVADAFGINNGEFLLQSVGGPVAWADMKARALRFLGLHGLARAVERKALRDIWPEARGAVESARRRMAVHESR